MESRNWDREEGGEEQSEEVKAEAAKKRKLREQVEAAREEKVEIQETVEEK